jgi:stage II sporulation protein D
MEGRNLPASRVMSQQNGIFIGQNLLPVEKIKITAAKDITIEAKGKKRFYRGSIEVVRKPQRTMLVVNTLDIEDYIKGVLYHEVSHRWPIEAIKAQAVAARSYAFYQVKQNKAKPYDLTNDIYSQVYGGRGSEQYRTNLAVNRTIGEILAYDGEILPAYFHATCGGHTEDVSELWKQDLPPLKGVVCEFCRLSPHYFWKKNFQSKTIQDKLNHKGHKIGLIEKIEVVERNDSERVRQLRITDREGKTLEISGKDFRDIIGPNTIRSNNYEILMQGYYFDLIGKGWGHGVGLCQWGAYGMSLNHYDYLDILNYYYPGADLITITSYLDKQFLKDTSVKSAYEVK